MYFNLILSAYFISKKPNVSSNSFSFIFIVIINELVLTF